MMHLSIRHITRYSYDPEAAQSALRLKLFPPQTAAQDVQGWTVSVNGTNVSPLLTDCLGDQVALWHAHQSIETIEIVAEGMAETSDKAGVLADLVQSARPGVFMRKTDLTKASDAILDMASAVEGTDQLERLHDLSELVQATIDYRPGATEASTTAAEAMAIGAGVCQDQSHVFIAAARSMNVPARYVVGYLFDPDRDDAADQTHAWAEAHVTGLGWVGFDITNQLCPTDGYVRLCCGLDAQDAAPVRGVVGGDAKEEMATEIAVAQAASQSQQ